MPHKRPVQARAKFTVQTIPLDGKAAAWLREVNAVCERTLAPADR